jgi:uncharacterized protein (TIGR02466 family)
VELSQNNHFTMKLITGENGTALAVETGLPPVETADFGAECIKAAKDIVTKHPTDKVALLLDESYESAVALMSFVKAEVKFDCYMINFVNLKPSLINYYNKVEKWANSFGVSVQKIHFDFNEPKHLEALKVLQERTGCNHIDQLFKIWASCDIDAFLVTPGIFTFPVFNEDRRLKNWNLPGSAQFELYKFFNEFGGVPFFLSYSPALVYTQVDSPVSRQLLAIAEGKNGIIHTELNAFKKQFAKQAFSEEIDSLHIQDNVEPVQIRALRTCGMDQRSCYYAILKDMSRAEPALFQNIRFSAEKYKEIIETNSYEPSLLALSERSEMHGNVTLVEGEPRDHKTFAAFTTLVTTRFFDGDFDGIFNYVKSLEYFKGGSASSTNGELHLHPKMKPLADFFLKSAELYFEEMKYVCEKLEIMHCWANKYSKDQHFDFHYHPNSFLSGVFYLTSGGGSTVFRDQRRPQLLPNTTHHSRWNYSSFEVYPEAGKLILFPSEVDHKTKPHPDPVNFRYTIAFNIMFKGPSEA